ncbi:AChain A [Histomonas meleagridis]|uniref:AChain A, DD D12 09 D12 n=1 Tax=Histomonas meleagridis TaxID=135588 RepID=UPI00355A3ECA|nr:AChain A [Histomonas meleagridis]KAH0803076.1 AChain A, DD D12 09 D12 [Histomonas meleagridis]
MQENLKQAAICCQENKFSQLQSLLQAGLNPNSIIPYFKTKTLQRRDVPLVTAAVYFDSRECLRLLINSGSNIEKEDTDPNPTNNPSVTIPLLIAAKNGHTKCVKVLLDAGVNVNQQDGTGRSALHLACWFGHIQLIPILLEHKATVALPDNEGHTPLHLACWFGYYQICELLIKSNAPLDIHDHVGRTPLHFAVQHNRSNVVELLLKSGANTKLKDCNGKTPEALAIVDERPEIIEIFQKFSRNQNKDNNIEEQQLIETEPIERQIYEEHQRMKSLVNKLVECRDRQFDHYAVLRQKIENQEIAQKILQHDQNDIQKHIEKLQQTLNGILLTFDAALHLEQQNENNQIKQQQQQQQAMSSRRSNSRTVICRKCNEKAAKLRCKHCRSPICQECAELIKQSGCPFCMENNKYN